MHEDDSFVLIKGWENPSGDTFFQNRRNKADTADGKARRVFYTMMKEIGFEMNNATLALFLGGHHADSSAKAQVLDLCIAPGGYSAAVLELNPTASIDALTLPQNEGGHQVLIHFGRRDPRVQILFTDITMLGTEFGVNLGSSIPTDQCVFDATKLSTLRPYFGRQYDLVLCDGQVLRSQKREACREMHEPTRLLNAQLILGLQRIRPGGTMIILLHKLEKWHTIELIRSFSNFASISLFKPAKKHAIKSSFYLIAKNIQPQEPVAKLAVNQWRKLWHRATFGSQGHDHGHDDPDLHSTDDGFLTTGHDPAATAAALEDFGPRLVSLGRTVWTIQADALEKLFSGKDWNCNAQEGEGKGQMKDDIEGMADMGIQD